MASRDSVLQNFKTFYLSRIQGQEDRANRQNSQKQGVFDGRPSYSWHFLRGFYRRSRIFPQRGTAKRIGPGSF